jgi:hypothetical protein
LAQDDYCVTLSEAEAVQFRNRFFQTYPGLKAWHRAQRDGEVTSYTPPDGHGMASVSSRKN